MKLIFAIIMMLGSMTGFSASTAYSVNSNTTWSAAFPSYCGNCTITIASGVTLTLNNSSMCDNCTITGGNILITAGFSFQSTTISNAAINASSSFTLNNSNSFNQVTAAITGSSSFTSNGALVITNSTFTFSNTASFTSNARLDLNASILYFNGNSHFLSNSSTVNLKTGSKIIAGDGSKSSAAYLTFYGQLNLVDASSYVIMANVNNYYLSWNTYTSASNGATYTTTNNNKNCGGAGQNACAQPNYYGGATLSSTGALPYTILATTIGDLKGSVNGNNAVKLSWTLSDASEDSYFQIEHSTDGEHFSALATIPADKTTSDYAYTDPEPVIGENDYRVKLIGIDGNMSYSKTISEQITEAGSLRIFPNPCTGGQINVRFPAVESAMIRIFTIDGKLLYMNAVNGQASYAINVNQAGNAHLLVVQIITKEKSTTFNVINN